MDDGLLFNLSNCKVIGVKLAVSNKLIKGAFLKIPIIEYFKFYNQNQRFKNDGNKSNSLIKNDNKYIEELIKKNTYLINELNKLENEFNKANSENRLLKRKLTDLENIIKEKDAQLNKSLSKVKDLEKILKNKSKDNLNLEKILSLMKELEEIKSKFPFQFSQNEKIMTITLISYDENIHYSLICKDTEIFSMIERQLYKEYPEFMENEIIFKKNDKIINRHLSLEENGIKNNDIINFKEKELNSIINYN